jgi:hypothetical protein
VRSIASSKERHQSDKLRQKKDGRRRDNMKEDVRRRKEHSVEAAKFPNKNHKYTVEPGWKRRTTDGPHDPTQTGEKAPKHAARRGQP